MFFNQMDHDDDSKENIYGENLRSSKFELFSLNDSLNFCNGKSCKFCVVISLNKVHFKFIVFNKIYQYKRYIAENVEFELRTQSQY